VGFTFSENKIKFYNDNGELCCFECESTEEIQMHHIVPKSRGGEKMISICYCCHQKAHHKKAKSVNHKQLVSEGIASSRAAGTKWRCITKEESKIGREAYIKKTAAQRQEIGSMLNDLKEKGLSYSAIADRLNSMGSKTPQGNRWGQQNIYRTLKRWKQDQKSS
jgi:hypothetical protein